MPFARLYLFQQTHRDLRVLQEFCTYVAGDGTGDSEEMIGNTATREECVNKVLAERSSATGATYSVVAGNPSCFAEFGMTGAVPSPNWQTCQFPAAAGLCEFIQGDGVGDSEENIGTAPDTMACVAMVLSQRPEANGATYSNDGGNACYAEFGMTSSNGSASWQTCQFLGELNVAGCVFGMGDGTGGTETSLGSAASEAECVTLVQSQQPTANGATYQNDGDLCFAEFGMTGRNDNAGWQTCSLVLGFCDYVVGDGVGGTEEMLGPAASREECVNMVLSQRPYSNGATYSTDGTTLNCYAEFGMTVSGMPVFFFFSRLIESPLSDRMLFAGAERQRCLADLRIPGSGWHLRVHPRRRSRRQRGACW